jgi:hypothetical protein
MSPQRKLIAAMINPLMPTVNQLFRRQLRDCAVSLVDLRRSLLQFRKAASARLVPCQTIDGVPCRQDD